MTHLRPRRLPGLHLTALLAILLTATALTAGPAVAQDSQGTVIDRTTTFNALADGQLCDDAGCATVSLHVSPDKFGETTIVCLTVETASTFEEGCADAAATFSMDTEDLTAATLVPTPVDLYASVCEGKICDTVFTRTVTVAATWTGTGEVDRNKETLGDHTGTCTTYHMIDGLVRDASVTVTLDGASFTVDQPVGLQVIEDATFRRPCV